jgi:hypothetical protein
MLSGGTPPEAAKDILDHPEAQALLADALRTSATSTGLPKALCPCAGLQAPS